MAKDLWIFDGYNVIHANLSFKLILERSLEEARERFVEQVVLFAMEQGCEAIVVFDGHGKNVDWDDSWILPRYVRVLFARRGKTADQEIEKRVYEKAKTRKVTVVTSDRILENMSVGAGALCCSSEQWYDLKDSASKTQQQEWKRKRMGEREFRVSDHLGGEE